MKSFKQYYNLNENKDVWNMSETEFIQSEPEGYIYKSDLDHEAEFRNGRIIVGSKFFTLEPEERKAIVYHEIGHNFDELLTTDEFNELMDKVDEGIFGPEMDNGLIKGINGETKPTENLAEAYSLLMTDDDFLKKNYPEARRFVADMALRKNMPVPESVLKDYPSLERRHK